jgi:AraC-like DNA-binding protein
LILEGEGWVQAGGHKTQLKKGFAYLFPAFCDFDAGCSQEMSFFFIKFNLDLIPGVVLIKSKETPQPMIWNGSPTFAEIVDALGTERIGDWFFLKSALLRIMSLFLNNSRHELEENLLRTNRYKNIFDAVEHNAYSEIRVSELAKKMGMATHVLAYAFKKDIGVSLKEYINRQFLRRACEAILRGDKKFREISQVLGFQNELYFSRFFKRERGESPRAYWKKNQLR